MATSVLPEVHLPCLTGQMLADLSNVREPLRVVLMVGVGRS